MKRREFLALSIGVAAAAACGEGESEDPPGVQAAVSTPVLPPRGTSWKGGLGYAFEDQRIVDYQVYNHLDTGYWFRGPQPPALQPGEHVVFAGAAQTFGRYSPVAFPQLTGEAANVPHLNLALPGSGPGGFAANETAMEWINASRFVVLQVLSGRSAGNSFMENLDGGKSVRYNGEELSADEAWDRAVVDLPTNDLWRMVDETRADWVDGYDTLTSKISVPTVLFYIGRKKPVEAEDEDRSTRPETRREAWGMFPQLVTRDMVEAVASMCTQYVESVSAAGMPQTLRDMVTGETVGTNGYYPSPEMHDAAAKKLIPVVREMWSA